MSVVSFCNTGTIGGGGDEGGGADLKATGGGTDRADIPMAKAEKGHSRCLDAFNVALDQTYGVNRWYASTKHLQLASLDFCAACRNLATLQIRVDKSTRRSLWVRNRVEQEQGMASSDKPRSGPSRVPALRARGMTWEISRSPALLLTDSEVLLDVETFRFGDDFNQLVESVSWPKGLKRMEFGCQFNQRLDGIVWPTSLKQLALGMYFNQAVDNVIWPNSLVKITFSINFNRLIDNVTWPASLRELSMGANFNQRVNATVWPASLKRLKMGVLFNQPIDKVVWPTSLQDLDMGLKFNQPIHNVAWPASLQRLKFGLCFNRPIDKVVWPISLRELDFGGDFNQPVIYVAWPVSLNRLMFGWKFDQKLEGMTKWSTGLEELHLRVGPHYGYSLSHVKWPPRLKKLTVSKSVRVNTSLLPSHIKLTRIG